MTESIIGSILVLSFFLVLHLFNTIPKLWRIYKLNGYLSWMYRQHSTKKRSSNLADHLYSLQSSLNLPSNSLCLLSWKDEESVDIILSEFLVHLSQSFFLGNLQIDKSIAKRTNEEYFLFLLYTFLYRFQNAESIRGEVLSTYSGKGARFYGFDKYPLTDFGIVYQKMFYISLAYCQRNPKLAMYCQNNELYHIEQNIKTRSVEFVPSSDISL